MAPSESILAKTTRPLGHDGFSPKDLSRPYRLASHGSSPLATRPVRVVESAPPIGIVVRREIIADVPLRVRNVEEFAALAPLADPRLVNPLAETVLDGATATTDVPLDAVDQIKFGSTGSGVAHPLSPPSTPCHPARAIAPPARLLPGPRYAGPAGLFP